MPVQQPSPATLKKYGLSPEEWRSILERQGGVCAICKQVPRTGRMVIDHFHQRGWKKLSPEKRKLAVRGVCCWWCNATYLGRGINVERARNVVRYLEEFEQRQCPSK